MADYMISQEQLNTLGNSIRKSVFGSADSGTQLSWELANNLCASLQNSGASLLPCWNGDIVIKISDFNVATEHETVYETSNFAQTFSIHVEIISSPLRNPAALMIDLEVDPNFEIGLYEYRDGSSQLTDISDFDLTCLDRKYISTTSYQLTYLISASIPVTVAATYNYHISCSHPIEYIRSFITPQGDDYGASTIYSLDGTAHQLERLAAADNDTSGYSYWKPSSELTDGLYFFNKPEFSTVRPAHFRFMYDSEFIDLGLIFSNINTSEDEIYKVSFREVGGLMITGDISTHTLRTGGDVVLYLNGTKTVVIDCEETTIEYIDEPLILSIHDMDPWGSAMRGGNYYVI